MDQLLVSPEEAAAATGSSRSRIYEEMACGALESVKIGRRRRIPVEALRDYVERLRQAQSEVA